MRWLVLVLLSAVSIGCGSRSVTPAEAPVVGSSSPSAKAPPVGQAPEPEPKFEDVPPPPRACSRLARDGTAGGGVDRSGSSGAGSCSDTQQALSELARALSETDPAARDGLLHPLESCDVLEPGLVRALRADLAPEGCADVITEGFVDEARSMRKEVRDAIVGLGIASKLSRLVRHAPAVAQPVDKARFMEFFEAALVPWIQSQARAIQALSAEGARLSGYGQGVVAIEAGLADMRFVELARAIPLPEDMASDSEVRDVYYAALDQALEPRKARGRDAALVGLRRFAELGVLSDPRVERARTLLSKLFGGRRIDALDGLLLPPVVVPEPGSVEQQLARRLPTFYARYWLGGADFTDEVALAQLAQRGVPDTILERLRASALSHDAALWLARAELRLGQLYWRAADFQAAVDTLSPLTAKRGADPEARFLEALGRVLSKGPSDAAQMMLGGPRYPEGVGGIEPLDAFARKGGPLAARAAFDAAYLMRLVPPLEDASQHFEAVADRFSKAARGLDGPEAERARELAEAARATARAVREGASSTPAAGPDS